MKVSVENKIYMVQKIDRRRAFRDLDRLYGHGEFIGPENPCFLDPDYVLELENRYGMKLDKLKDLIGYISI